MASSISISPVENVKRPNVARSAKTTASAPIVGDRLTRRFRIEDIYPSVDGGRYPVKRVAGEAVEVWADIFRDGHDVSAAEINWRLAEDTVWRRAPMRHVQNDRWAATFVPTQVGRYVFQIAAWTDTFATWRREVLVKRAAGQAITLEAREGRALVSSWKPAGKAAQAVIARACEAFDRTGDIEALLSDELAAVAADSQERPDLTSSALFPLLAEREIARTGAWYEMLPRSQGKVPGRHGTFDDCIARAARDRRAGLRRALLHRRSIRSARTNRKGRNNALTAGPDDPGQPLRDRQRRRAATTPIHPELGTLEDFRRLVAALPRARHGDRARLRRSSARPIIPG